MQLQEELPSTSQKQPEMKAGESQQKIHDVFKRIEQFKDGGTLSNKITQAIVYMICKDSEPFYLVEHNGFRHLMKTTVPQYKVPSAKTIKKCVIDKYNDLSAIMKEKLQNKNCTLTTDIWSDNNMQSFLSLTVHFYDEDINDIYSTTLGVSQLTESHTIGYVANELQKLCREWGLRPNTDDVTTVVTDNCANIVGAAKLTFGEKKHIGCLAHILNLVLEKCLIIEEVSALISKVKAIVRWFKQSVIASDELRKLTELRIIQSVLTRWNSTFYMLQRFIDIRPYVNEIVNVHSNAPPMLTASDMEDITEIVKILEPFETATKKISGESYLTSSLAIPIISIISDEIKDMKTSKETPTKFLKEVNKEMVKRFGQIESVFLLAIATLLDPRFKRLYFKEPTALAKVINFVSNSLKKSEAEKEKEIESSSSNNEEARDETKKRKKKDLFSKHDQLVKESVKKRNVSASPTTMADELLNYLGAAPCKMEIKPLNYWKEMEVLYPNLAKMARIYLSTMATSVPSERLFSKAGEIKNNKRNKLKGKLLSKLLFLQSADDRIWGLTK